MTECRRGVTWGGFLLVIGTAALLSIVPLPFPPEDRVGFYLWYWLGWSSLGAFVGMTAVTGIATRDFRSLWHVAVSLVTLICLRLLLRDQHFFGSTFMNLLCSAAVIAALLKCCAVNWQFPPGVRGFARPVTIVTALAMVIRLGSPPHFFLPIVYNPEWNLARSRSTIVVVFLSAMVAAIVVGTAVLFVRRHHKDRREQATSFLERSIPSTSVNRIVTALAAIFGTLVFLWYFVLGLCTMSGAQPYPFRSIHLGDQAAVLESASEYLTAHGARRTDEEHGGFRYERSLQGPPLASFEYPLHFGRVMQISIFPDKESDGHVKIAYRCSGVTARDMGKARRFTDQIRQDPLKQAAQIQQAKAGQ